MTFRTILVGMDFSNESEVALAQAESLARRSHARIVLVHAAGVTETGHYMYEVADRPEEPWKRYVRKLLDEARKNLQATAARSRARGMHVEHHLASGFPDEAIVEQAKLQRADLVVVGTHGRAGFDHFLLGSVAERVTRLAPCHVLVARRSTAPEPPRRLLVPSDFSPISEIGLRLALSVAAPGAVVEVLHAWQRPYLGGGDEAPDWIHDVHTDGERRGQQLLERYGRADVTMELALVEGPPAGNIVQRMQQTPFDLLVIGSHGRRGVRRALLGSVAERVVRHAPISVLVAHGS